ncbi:MAG: universal stress protein [Planctomycetaceae bacterium]|jgi:nucleotide-binding universal stress UspA family protein|nr:universal stress protein [Planctomycetaceae bacterium]MBT6487563.1 universal stress protein [Planctomycetaceae bacterium]MBT6493221.1 universal stress protein [Planctomycetaceae bacterium]
MKILFATDSSVHSEAAICLLNRFPFPAESELTLLDVFELPPPFVSKLEQQELLQDWNEQLHLEMKAAFTRQTSSLERARWKVNTTIREGHAAREIVSAAKELDADLVVVGSHGRDTVTRFLLGSVSNRIVPHAPCSTWMVR